MFNPSKFTAFFPFLIGLLAILFFFPFLGLVHLFDWDEINFAESAREMLVTGNYSRVQIDFKPFWEKPPLFFWLQVLSMKLFGVNEYAARFPNAVFGVITLVSFYLIGKKLYSPAFGFIWALSYLGSFLPHLYFKSGIIDPVFNYFIFMSVYFLARTIHFYGQSKSTPNAVLAGLFIGLAILTKGPVGLLLLMLTFFVFAAMRRFKSIGTFKDIALFTLSAFTISFLWFGIEIFKNGFWFLEEFITYQIRLFSTPDAGHGQPFYYHFVVVFLGCFPISILALRSFKSIGSEPEPLQFRRWMIILFWVVMILFSIVTTKIVHYSSLSYFPVSFLAAYHLHALLNNKLKLTKITLGLLLFTGFIFSLLLTALPILGMNIQKLVPYVKDSFAAANFQAEVHWGGWEPVIGVLYFMAILWAIRLFKQQVVEKAVIWIFLATASCMFAYTAIVVPKIEQYTQNAAISFYERLRGRDVYVDVIGFKSYAQLFYFDKPQPATPHDNDWLLHGNIDKPAYFVTKIDRVEQFRAMPQLIEIDNKNGFVFFRRDPLKISE